MNNIRSENKNNSITKVIKGIIYSFLVTLVSVFVLSVTMTYTNISERVIPIVIIVISFMSVLIGAVISMRKTSKNGMVNGAIVGGGYVVLLYLTSSILNVGFAMNIYTIVMIIGGTISGIIGGIIGVNT